ncbi:MAG: hypothetical protein AAF468_21850 [Pseudomonadota bacterium]
MSSGKAKDVDLKKTKDVDSIQITVCRAPGCTCPGIHILMLDETGVAFGIASIDHSQAADLAGQLVAAARDQALRRANMVSTTLN